MYDFGLRLQELRKKCGFSQAAVASRLGLHSGTISAYENNIKTPSVGVLGELAFLYGTSIDYLLGHEKRETLSLEGLTEGQKEILYALLIEFKNANDSTAVDEQVKK